MKNDESETDYSPKPMEMRAAILLFVKVLIAGGIIAAAIWALDHFGV